MIKRLSAAGYKVTGPRKRVLEALYEAGTPWTAQEVAERAGTSVASTYRVLGLLVELGVVSEVTEACDAPDGPDGPDGRSRRYALCSAVGHHHHFVCRSCHAILEIASDDLERALAEIERNTGLQVESHEITLRGQCPRCQGGHPHERYYLTACYLLLHITRRSLRVASPRSSTPHHGLHGGRAGWARLFRFAAPEIFSLTHEQGLDSIIPMLALVSGFLAFHVVEKLTLLHQATDGAPVAHKHPQVGVLSALALSGHSFQDGVGIGIGFKAGAAIGTIVALAVIAHDFSDGLNTVTLMLINRNSRGRALAAGARRVSSRTRGDLDDHHHHSE